MEVYNSAESHGRPRGRRNSNHFKVSYWPHDCRTLSCNQLLEDDSDSHPANKQARADRTALVKVRKELSELRSTHETSKRELERVKDINDQSIVEYLALTRSVSDWKRSYGSLQKQLADKTQEFATLSATCEKKDKELECLREGNYYDEFSD